MNERPIKTGSLEELIELLSSNGWTQISPQHVHAYEEREGTLIAVVHDNGVYGAKNISLKFSSSNEITIVGASTGNEIDTLALNDGAPCLFWSPVTAVTPEQARQRMEQNTESPHHTGPADPFGDDPTRTQAMAAKHLLDTWMQVGFTREEAMQFVLQIHQDELDHYSQHCLTNHANSGEQWGQYDQDDEGEQHG